MPGTSVLAVQLAFVTLTAVRYNLTYLIILLSNRLIGAPTTYLINYSCSKRLSLQLWNPVWHSIIMCLCWSTGKYLFNDERECASKQVQKRRQSFLLVFWYKYSNSIYTLTYSYPFTINYRWYCGIEIAVVVLLINLDRPIIISKK